nr:hypothetical protein [Rhodococcus qingshengii]
MSALSATAVVVSLIGATSTTTSVISWSFLLATISITTSPLPGMPLIAYLDAITPHPRPGVPRTKCEALRSRWFFASSSWYASALISLLLAKYSELGRWIVYLLPVASLAMIYLGYIASRELKRTHRRTVTTPMLLEGVAAHSPYPAALQKPLWSRLGPDWVAPDCILTKRTANAYGELAADRATTLHHVGKGLPRLFGLFAAASIYWSFDEQNPFAVALPIVLSMPVILGWSLERRAALLDKLADTYTARVSAIHPWNAWNSVP